MSLECVSYRRLPHSGFPTQSSVKAILIVLITCSGISLSYAQKYNYKVEQIPLENDLYGFSGTCILQDRDGFMWFGSQNGLFRYDGKRFKKYIYDPEDSTSISHEEVAWLLEDDEGIIWVSTVNGLNKFNKETGDFEYYLNEAPGETRNWYGSGHFIQASDGYLYVSFIGGFSRFDRETGQFKNFATPDSLNGDDGTRVYFLYENSQGDIWVREDFNDLYLFHKETEEFERVIPQPYYYMDKIYEDVSGRTWITSHHEIYHYTKESNTSVPYLKDLVDPGDMEYLRFIHLLEDRDGTFWVNSFKGIHNLDQDMKEIYSWYYPRPLIPSVATYLMAKAVIEDRSGNIWFYTEDAINKVVKDQANFQAYDPWPEETFTVKAIAVEGLNSIWFADYSRVYNYDPATELIQEYTLSDQWAEIVDIQIDHQGNIWVSTIGNGLFKAKRKADGSIHFEKVFSDPADSTNLPGLRIYFLTEDSHNRIWIKTRDHLPCYLDLDKNRIFHLKNNPELKHHLHPGAWIHCENTSGELMVSDNLKVYALNPILKDLSDHSVSFSEIRPISRDSARFFKELVDIYPSVNDSSKSFWLLSDGLLKYEPGSGDQAETGTEKFTRYHLKDGLPSSSVSCILEDREGNLWLGTNTGLVKFNPQNESITLYTENEGLSENSFTMAADKSPDGKLFFGTRNGLVSFYPDSMKKSEEVAPVFITDLKINNEAFQFWDDNPKGEVITFVESISLKHDENNLLIEYAALDFAQSSKIQYECILEGLDREWIYAGNRAEVNYNNLDPGKYTFRVLGSNHDGVWNEEGASLHITIHPPPWRAWWAFIMYGIILVLMIRWYRSYLLARAKLRTELEVEKIEKEKVLEMDQMRSRFFANISHEFRTPLTLILGPIEDATRKRSERIELHRDIIGVMHRNAKRLQQLINQLLDVSKLEAGNIMLQVSEGSLDELVKTIVISYESLAVSKQIKFAFDLQGTSGKVCFDRDKVEKILSNLLSNAFKFTPAGGEVYVTMLYVQFDGHQFAEIKVSDTGIGIPANKLEKVFDRFYQVSDSDTRTEEGMGIGLALTKELVDLYRGEINAESTLGKGSTFRVKIPVSAEQFTEDEAIKEKADPGLMQEDPSEIETTESSTPGTPKDAPIILVVEDNADLSNYMVSILGGSYRVLTAENGVEGLELATESIPDLVISDVMMPHMDGMELCSKLKSNERTSHIPVVMLTARADRGSKLEGLETGADDYIIKPFDAEELKVRVRNMIDQRKKLIERFRKEFESDSAESGAPPGDQLLDKLMTILNQHLADPEFNIAQMHDELHMSRAQMFRKVSAITGYTPKELIRNMRLKKAAGLFRSGHHHVALVMHQVGFNNQSYFAECFSKLYGLTPSEYIRSNSSQALAAE